MQTVDIHEAQSHLSRLVEEAADGKPFIIAKAGKPLVKTALDAPLAGKRSRLGYISGHIAVPEDFDRMSQAETEHLFGV